MANGHGGKRKNAGRKKGSAYLTQARIKLLESQDEIIDSLIREAKAGDVQALKLCVERLVPVVKEQPIFMDCENETKTVLILETIRAHVLAGEISLSEAMQQAEFIKSLNGKIAIEKNSMSFEEFFNQK